MRVSFRKAPPLRPGDAIAATARLLPPPEAARPGGYDFARDAYFQGIGAVGSLLGAIRIETPSVAPPLRLRLAAMLDEDEHAAMLLDQAGWHGAHGLVVPGNVTLVPLPPYAPQLNPVERVWLYLRERHLSHRLLDGYDAIVDACCAAWNQLIPAARIGDSPVMPRVLRV